MFIDHGNHRLGTLHGSQCCVDRSTERDIPVRIGRRHLNHRHITGQHSATIQFLGFTKEYRDVVSISGLGHLTHVASHEEGIQLKDTLEFRSRIGSRTFCVKVMDMHMFELFIASSFAHGLDQALRRACDTAQMHMVAAFNHFHCFGSGNELNFFGHSSL